MRLQGMILDWAGTVVDHGSRAPVVTLQEVFAAARVPISIAEARMFMGLAKKSHIQRTLEIPRVRAEWGRVHGSAPAAADTEALYECFVPKQLECLRQYSDVIAGVAAAVGRFRSQGLKIGTTTGYTRTMLDYLVANAREQGFEPDSSVCPDEVPSGRPTPWMCYLNAIRLERFPLSTYVKIGDTPSDIEEGLNAGMWTIGITRTGNEAGLTEAEWFDAPTAKKEVILMDAGRRLTAAGAHYLAESVAECDGAIEQINLRLQRGETPKVIPLPRG